MRTLATLTSAALTSFVIFSACAKPAAIPVKTATTNAPPLAERIAKSAGADVLARSVRRLKFTWRHEAKQASRSYDWDLAQKRVTVTTAKGKATIALDRGAYQGDQLEAHRAFINDSYWLLFEAQLLRTNAELRQEPKRRLDGFAKLGELDALSVNYPGGGYTPGHRYVLYADENARVHAWAFYPKPAPRPAFILSREGHKSVGGLSLPTQFRKPDGTLVISILNLAVERY